MDWFDGAHDWIPVYVPRSLDSRMKEAGSVRTVAAVFSGKIGVPKERAQSNRKLPEPVRQEEGGLPSCLGEGNR